MWDEVRSVCVCVCVCKVFSSAHGVWKESTVACVVYMIRKFTSLDLLPWILYRKHSLRSRISFEWFQLGIGQPSSGNVWLSSSSFTLDNAYRRYLIPVSHCNTCSSLRWDISENERDPRQTISTISFCCMNNWPGWKPYMSSAIWISHKNTDSTVCHLSRSWVANNEAFTAFVVSDKWDESRLIGLEVVTEHWQCRGCCGFLSMILLIQKVLQFFRQCSDVK